MPDKRLQLQVGIFAAIAFALLVAGVGLLAGDAFFKANEDYMLYFEGSVAGLAVGAPVVFRGVPLGRVTSISLVAHDRDDTIIIPVGIDIFRDNIKNIIGDSGGMTNEARDRMIQSMVGRGLRARIAIVSLLTGQARIELDFFPEAPLRYHSADPSTEIPTLASPLEEFSRALARINIDKIARSLFQALEAITSVMGSEELKDTLAGLKRTADELSAVAQNMPALVESARRTLQRIETAADRTAQEVPRLGRDMSLALDSFSKAADRAEKLFLNTSRLSSPKSAMLRDVQSAVHELTEAARAVRSLAKTLERSPESLLRGKGKQQP
ncbi:MAG: MlaD family protein [Deltaproteobacteria bacterium]|nr:MlaD family protein [Deltaproteobacteria bacterium]